MLRIDVKAQHELPEFSRFWRQREPVASSFRPVRTRTPSTTRSVAALVSSLRGGFHLQERGSGAHLHVGYGHHLADFSGKWGDHLHLHFHGLEHGQAIPHRHRVARFYRN